jgi:hypothetical protein
MPLDRCPGGESLEQMQHRVDTVIQKVWENDPVLTSVKSNSYLRRCANTIENTRKRAQTRETS